MLRSLDRALFLAVRAASWLVLPVSFLLFLQWPLREVVQGFSREANDLAQVLFALYVAVAITAATRDGSHLAADTFARRYSAATRKRLLRLGSALVAVPLALLVIAAGAPAAWMSLMQLERFPETLNAGYFVVRAAALLLAVLVFAQGALDLLAPRDREGA
ncbi:MAG: TRAP transporter small permease subunit [Usitatibacter sp.]